MFKRGLSLFLIVAATLTCYETKAVAMLVPPDAATQSAVRDRAESLAKVQTFLEQKVVRQRLHEFGLSDGQIEARLNNLSDQQLHQVASRIDKQNPAGDASGAVITVLAIGVLVLLFVYLLRRV